ncbi:MAG TPA: hypothetical protein VKZ41_10265 [Gemmatimonadales bacterium]|nr:hypothetical protein [Gemmatimonadales bacterium]
MTQNTLTRHTTTTAQRRSGGIAPHALTALVELYRCEARLLDDLTGVLHRQQVALESDDLDAVDDTVFALHRVLGTLAEARRRRNEVHAMIAGVEQLDSEAIDKLLGGDPPHELVEARSVLRSSARELAGQVSRSRARLEGAVANGAALIRSVYGEKAQEAPAGWTQSESPHGGMLLNRTA